ncbi:MAG: mechanosensitive ion channel domain-containing protein [Verrucomicrobiota bacterium]|nr:mechanosensitive ion channel domain-containing protein [Verrucomicrobiota bacterium]MED5453915.1 mechanosensitive ion channel domain-containing protein [Verrucomicrobiota bacterium]|tara:strand:+ start:388 stop:993 length:606 start_codon:yes stop_codon:yes gene_type:complete
MNKIIIYCVLGMFLFPNFVFAQQETNVLERIGIESDLSGLVADWSQKIALSLLILIGFWILAIVIRKIIRKAGTATGIDSSVVNLLARIANVVLWVIGLVTALGTVGINVSAIVASLGLTGFAVGFALKDSISNLLSGVLILIYRPFRVGQWISVKSFEGFVMAIDLRYTTLEQGEEKILVPNSLLFTNPISIRAKSESVN